MNNEVLAEVARRMGWSELLDTDLPPSAELPNGGKTFLHWKVWQSFGSIGVEDIDYSDGELMLQVLQRAKEHGIAFRVTDSSVIMIAPGNKWLGPRVPYVGDGMLAAVLECFTKVAWA